MPDRLQRQFQGLSNWDGLNLFREKVNAFVGVADANCLLSSRTKELMRFSSLLMFSRCRRVLVSDLTWPPYVFCLAEEARRRNAKFNVVSISKSVLSGEADRESVADAIADEYMRLNCDGLFLPALSHLGVKLPIEIIADKIRANGALRFLVLDASQAAGQVPLDSLAKTADLAFFGTHKWISSFTPLGIATLARHESRAFILDSAKRWLQNGLIQDPLWQFVDGKQELHFGETVNLTPIFCAGGAILDAENETTSSLHHLHEPTDALCNGWNRMPISKCLQSKILMLQRNSECREKQLLRREFAKHGVSVTTYDGGKCRISIPMSGLCGNSIEKLNRALSSV